MNKKAKKISISKMDEIMNTLPPNEAYIEWNGVEMAVNRYLSLEDMVQFVDSVVNSCFSSDDGAYMPEVKDFAIRVNIMARYANFRIPEKTSKQYDFAVQSGAVEAILKYIDKDQFNSILSAIDAKVNHILASNVAVYTKKFDAVMSSFENLQNTVESMFENINPSDIQKLSSALSDGTMEQKIVSAYMDASKNKDERE